MKKSRINKLIPIANAELQKQYDDVKQEFDNSGEQDAKKKAKIWDKAILRKDDKNLYYIKESYDGKVSAFGVTVALSGLRPALAMYYNESGDVKTQPVLEVIAKIIVEDKEYKLLTDASAKGLVQHALNVDTDLKKLTGFVLEAAIALKQTVRTYELK